MRTKSRFASISPLEILLRILPGIPRDLVRGGLRLLRTRARIGVVLATLCVLPATAVAQVNHVDSAALKALVAQGVPVVDIRTPGEWKATGVIEGSHLITFFDERNQFDLDAWMAKFSKIADPEQPVVIICAAGVRSAAVSQVLDVRLNYSAVTNVARGINDWRRRGGDVVPWTP